MRVCKFGGSSLPGPNEFRNAASIICSNRERRVAVFSAPGVRGRGDEKITDVLFRIGDRAKHGRSFWKEQKVLTDRFRGIESDLTGNTSTADRLIESINERLGQNTAMLVSMGEEFSCLVMIKFMRRNGINTGMFDSGVDLPVRVGEDGAVSVHSSDYRGIKARLVSLLNSHELVCTPGFYGVDENGERRLFSRGGSDYTMVILGKVIGAECEKFTNVCGIMDKDPRIHADASLISRLGHSELTYMTGNGCGIVQHEAAELMRDSGIRLQISSSFSPSVRGTVVG